MITSKIINQKFLQQFHLKYKDEKSLINCIIKDENLLFN